MTRTPTRGGAEQARLAVTGAEVSSPGDVTQAEARLAADGLAIEPEPGATCCYALQFKVWAHDPEGLAWEYYVVLEHIETP